MRFAAFFCTLLLLPSLAFAAGFAKNSLFLSKASVTEGESVLIHAVVENDGATAFSGTLNFTDADQKIGSLPVSLAAGGADTESISWKPIAGSHTVTAALTSKDGTVVESESATFLINAKPAPAQVPQPQIAVATSAPEGVGSSQPIQDEITSVSPQAGSALEPLFTVVDGLRGSAANFLDAQLSHTKANLTQPAPEVLGAATQNPLGSTKYILSTIYLYVLTILRWLVGNAGVFYPFLLLVFVYLLWRSYRWVRRPSY